MVCKTKRQLGELFPRMVFIVANSRRVGEAPLRSSMARPIPFSLPGTEVLLELRLSWSEKELGDGVVKMRNQVGVFIH